jgi:hypothetical protein
MRFTLAFALALTGCATTTDKPPVPEMLLVTENVRVGTVLSGPLVERAPDELDWEAAWMLAADVAYVDTLPAGGLPVSGRVVVIDGAPQVFGTSSQLAADVRLAAEANSEGERAWERKFVLALPAGVTVQLGAELGGEIRDNAATAWDRFSLEVSRSAEDPDRIDAALVLEGAILPPRDLDAEEDTPAELAPIDVSERIVLEAPPVPDGDALRFIFPAPTHKAPNGGFLVDARVTRNTGEASGFAEALANGRRLADEAHARALASVHGFDEGEGFHFESDAAMRAMTEGKLQRPALIFLAQSTGATVTEELALIAAPETLGEFTTEVARLFEALEQKPEGAQAFGWFLERSVFVWLCARAEDEKRELEPELFSVLHRQAGELARYPDLLREVIQRSVDVNALAAELIRGNRIFLEDAHPAARVRAYDWLVAHGATPADFDPLGPLAERRAGLALLQEEIDTVPASAPAAVEGGAR